MDVSFSRKLASASWSLLALASIGGAAQGHHVIFHAKGPPPVISFCLRVYTMLSCMLTCTPNSYLSCALRMAQD